MDETFDFLNKFFDAADRTRRVPLPSTSFEYEALKALLITKLPGQMQGYPGEFCSIRAFLLFSSGRGRGRRRHRGPQEQKTLRGALRRLVPSEW
jgi:hypothetical protein